MLNFLCPRRAARSERSSSRAPTDAIDDPEGHALTGSSEIVRVLTPLEQWHTSPKRLENLQVLLAHETNNHTIIDEFNRYKQQQADRYSFVNVLKCYRGWLDRKMSNTEGEAQLQALSQELSTVLVELSLSAMAQGLFSYMEISRLRGLPGRELIRFIAEKVASTTDKKAMLLSVVEHCYREAEEFLMEYLQFSLDLSESVFQIFMFSEEEQRMLEAKGINFEGYSLLLKIIMVLVKSYQNYQLATKLVVILRSEYPHRSSELKQMEYRLKLCSYFLYSSNRYSLDYERVSTMSGSQVMHELLSCEPTHSIEALRPIFEVLGEHELDRTYECYVFSQLCQLDVSIQLLEEHRVPTTEDTTMQLLQKVRKGHFEYSRYIKKLQSVFGEHIHDEEVKKVFDVLEMASIFYYFSINEPLAVLEGLLRMDEKNIQTLQEDSLRLLRELLTQYCQDAYPDKRATINGVIYDFDTPEILLSLTLYLKQRLFGRLLSESLVHQMIFQHLLHFNRLRELEILLKPKNLEDNCISYSMVEMVVVEHINELFERSGSWAEIRDIVEYLVGLLKTRSVERRSIRSMYKLANYLEKQGCMPGRVKLPRPLNITFLYSLLNVKAQLNFEKVYKYILKIKAPNLERVDLNTKEFTRFQGELAQRLYRKGLYQQGCELFNKLAVHRPSWLAGCAIRIIDEVPELPLKQRQPLLVLAYQHSVHSDQFERLLRAGTQLTSTQGVKHDLLSYYKKVLGNNQTYTIGDPNFILKEEQYTNLVAEAKFTEGTLNEPPYELFFVLLANEYQRAFYYAYREKLEPAKLEFFLKECMRIQLVDFYMMIPTMLKMLVAVARQSTQQILTPYKQFKIGVTQADIQVLDKQVDQLLEIETLDHQLKTLLRKYHVNTKICLKCPQSILQRQFPSRNDLTKFFEDRSYRKRFLADLLNKPPTNDLPVLQKLAQLEELNYMELAVQTLSDSLNRQVVPKTLLNLIGNVNRLLAGSQPLTRQFVMAVSQKTHSSRMLFLLLGRLRQLDHGSAFEEVILQDNLAILDSISRLEKNNEFFGLLPPDFAVRELRPRLSPSARLTNQHEQQLRLVLSLDNVFVLGKLMYFIYGLDERIERETLELAKHQSPELATRLQQLRERPQQN